MSTPARTTLSGLLGASTLGEVLARLDAARVKDVEGPRDTIAARAAAMSTALATLDDEKLIELQEVLSGYVDELATAEVAFDGAGTDLSAQQLVYLMRRDQDTRKIEELSKVVKAGLKRIVFEAVTAKVAAADPDEPHPDQVSGFIAVPEMGKKFCKEGMGRAAPLLKIESDGSGPGLRETLGEAVWAQVTTTRTVPAVPAHQVTELSDVLLMAKAMQDPEVMTKLEAALIDAGWKSGSFTVRDL